MDGVRECLTTFGLMKSPRRSKGAEVRTIDLGSGDRLHVSWAYDTKNRITVAILTMYGNGMPLEMIGTSKAAKVDKWDKAVGRKLSLTRAVEGLPKEDRKRVWDAYFNRSPKGVKYL